MIHRWPAWRSDPSRIPPKLRSPRCTDRPEAHGVLRTAVWVGIGWELDPFEMGPSGVLRPLAQVVAGLRVPCDMSRTYAMIEIGGRLMDRETKKTGHSVVFPSKVDGWLGVVLIGMGVVPFVLALFMMLSVGFSEGVFTALIGVFNLGLLFGLTWPVHYTVTETELVIRFGLIHQSVRLDEIFLVEPSQSLLSAPALSLDRMKVHYDRSKGRSIVISPADRDGFYRALLRVGNLERSGDHLVEIVPPR